MRSVKGPARYAVVFFSSVLVLCGICATVAGFVAGKVTRPWPAVPDQAKTFGVQCLQPAGRAVHSTGSFGPF